jgi:hypothetical protein
MATIYISSTYDDLIPFRRMVFDSLVSLGHRVLAMEHYLAADDRPLDRCLRDVASCDVYVGVFAWRYGFVPQHENANGSSITELEYRHARALNRPVLIFLLHEDAPWVRRWQDSVTGENGRSIENFRKELQDNHVVSFFNNDEQLARLVSAAVTQWDQSRARLQSELPSDTAGGSTVVPDSYLEWVKRACGSVELLGLRLKHGQSVRIGSVYVPLHVTAGITGPGVAYQTGLLDLVSQRSVYVSGNAGAGKSTFCRWLAWLLATGSMPNRSSGSVGEDFPEPLRGKLPLLIKVRDFHQSLPPTRDITAHMFEAGVSSWLAQRKPGGLEWPAVKHSLKAGNTVMMFDGIDEAPPAARERLIKGLGECAPLWMHTGNRIVATSRPYGVPEEAVRQLGLPHLSVGILSDQMQRLLISRWFEILADDPENGRTAANGLIEDLQERVWLRPLAENPLLLTSICIVYGQGRRLPEDKYELYDRIVDTVLHNRFDAGLVPSVRNNLAVVAHGMHVGSDTERRDMPVAQTNVKEIDRMLDAYQQARVWTEEGFKRVADSRDQLLSDSGLLQPVEHRGASFSHLSFQEFLSAERFADLDRERIGDVFREHGGKPEWRNTLTFLFGAQLANNVSPRRAVEVILGVLDHFVETGDVVRALLAADCVEILRGRKVNLEDEPLRRMRQACLAGMRGSRRASERCGLGEALARVGDHRFRHDLWWLPKDDLLGFVEVPALPALYMARFPVTVAQFRAFVEDRTAHAERSLEDPTAIRGLSNHPVVRISPAEAIAYCRWLTTKLQATEWSSALQERMKSAGHWEVRLPLEAEWRAAAGGSDNRKFPWGTERDPARFNGEQSGIGATSSVGCFPNGVNALGIEELSGNVWEWARRSVPAVSRLPSGRRGRAIERCVGRGSSYQLGDGSLASSLVPEPEAPLSSFGFRVVLALRSKA